MGRKSYEQTLSFGEWNFKNHHTYVFTRSKCESKSPNTTIVTNPSIEFIKSLMNEDGRDIWLFGGGDLNHFFLENDLIDEIMLFVQPVALGSGIGIFGNKPVELKTFKRKKSCELDKGFTLLWYQR